MKPAVPNNPSSAHLPPAAPSGVRLVILVPLVFLLGAVLTGLWFKYGKSTASSLLPGAQLSGNTLALLRQLNAPVEIRFYSVLPPGSAPESLQAFAGRVGDLLSEFQNANDAKIHVTRTDSATGAGADAATADGIRPFNLDKGDACFLGLTIVSGGQKESLSQLQPEWETALEFDLARAIARVTAAQPPAAAPAAAPVSPEVTNDVIRLIPDPQATSVEDGTRILREAAFKEFTSAGAETEKQIQAAQQRLAEAQNGPSEAEQQAALKHLQEVQLAQGETYKKLAARLQAELTLFEQMKAAAPGSK